MLMLCWRDDGWCVLDSVKMCLLFSWVVRIGKKLLIYLLYVIWNMNFKFNMQLTGYSIFYSTNHASCCWALGQFELRVEDYDGVKICSNQFIHVWWFSIYFVNYMCICTLIGGIHTQSVTLNVDSPLGGVVNLTLWSWHNEMCLQMEWGSLNSVPRWEVNGGGWGFKILTSNRR